MIQAADNRPAWLVRDLREGDLVRTPLGLGTVRHGTGGCRNPEFCSPPYVLIDGAETPQRFDPTDCTLLCRKCGCLYHGREKCPDCDCQKPEVR